MKFHRRWFVAFVLFMSLLLHQANKLLIGPLTTSSINEAQMGAVSSLATVVAAILSPPPQHVCRGGS